MALYPLFNLFSRKELKAAIRHHDQTALKVGKFYRSQVGFDQMKTTIPFSLGDHGRSDHKD